MPKTRVCDYSIVVPVYFNEGSLRYTADRIFSEVFAVYPEKRGEEGLCLFFKMAADQHLNQSENADRQSRRADAEVDIINHDSFSFLLCFVDS